MIDLHTHVLPGVDDGPGTVEGSIELARAAAADGTTTLVATPHVSWEFPENDAARIAAAVEGAQRALDAAGVDVRVRAGGEVALTRAHDLDDDELRALRLGGGDWLLAECPLSSGAIGFDSALLTLAARGHRIVLAHPERAPLLQRDPETLRRLVSGGMLTSITAGALLGRFGSTVRRFALWMLEEDLVHNVASDAHDARRRPPGMREALEAAERELPGVAARVEWLTLSVPGAILDGDPIPDAPGPVPAPRRRGLFRRAARQR
ncbi:MAG TPA: CpsB/CapC family capsule biosynthesis tyrosine phosphatase [Solirubrobacteraceae bacterium]|nr:CpsB/CapC family capsule biosynthesis tyrosine phosphatase [Solirubrobacteraceae bacterium]